MLNTKRNSTLTCVDTLHRCAAPLLIVTPQWICRFGGGADQLQPSLCALHRDGPSLATWTGCRPYVADGAACAASDHPCCSARHIVAPLDNGARDAVRPCVHASSGPVRDCDLRREAASEVGRLTSLPHRATVAGAVAHGARGRVSRR